MDTLLRQVGSYMNELNKMIVKETKQIENITICNVGYKKDNTPPAESEFKPFENGGVWGEGIDSHAWFHFTVNVPESMQGDDSLELQVDSSRAGWDADNPQFLIYIDGIMRQGMDVNHRSVYLGSNKNTYDVYVYGYTGPRLAQTHMNAYLFTKNKDVEKLYFDIHVPHQALGCMQRNTVEFRETLTILSNTLKTVDFLEPREGNFFRTVKEADEYIQKALYSKSTGEDTKVICIGHTHIDIAWLWTVGQTREKAQRSFATVVELMKRYPEYKFMSSQAYLYKAVKEEAPELYEEIKKLIKEGRWEVEGAMWVEADCNLTSGESLVRQVVYGKYFFKDEFGVDSRVLWLPDVFGYSAALPQILTKAGVKWFVTSKISWNDVNIMPYDIFSWKGLDGTPINSFFLTAQDKGPTDHFNKGTTYVANTNPTMIAGAYNRLQQKELSDKAIVTFGYGDGGGGPTWEMLEIAKRQEQGLPGLPKVEIGFAGKMLSELEKRIENDPHLPEWQGELYLEFHRGTYTSNAKNKKNNRNCEFLLLNTEFMSELAAALGSKKAFPQEKLRGAWEKLLVDQFHDIIPGSSIREVYEDSDKDYAEIRSVTGEIISENAKYIAENVNTDKEYIVFNPHSFEGKGIVTDENGFAYYVEGIPSKGYKAISFEKGADRVKAEITKEGGYLENRYYTIVFDSNMEISSIYDKLNDRNVLKPGTTGNQLRIYEDYPDQYDAWEIQEFSGYKYKPLKAFNKTVVEQKGDKTGIHIIREHSGSTIEQIVWLYNGIKRIDFETNLDWHSKHRILRAAFPVDINTDKATFEVQFGNLQRPTHKNTSWDRQKFETCGHKYADMSEGNYGISLINDCKYGHNIHGDTMELTLLKCPAYPNEVADEGAHKFTYSLLPHEGPLGEDTLKEAFYLNYPMYAVKASKNADGTLPEEFSYISTKMESFVVETVKKAEYSDSIVIRGYEALNRRGRTSFRLGFPVKSLSICDLMEQETEPVEFEIRGGNTYFTLNVKPFEIITLKADK